MVTNQVGLPTHYEYRDAPSHYLESATDSLGNTVLMLVYDEHGTFTHAQDAYGNIVNSQNFEVGANTGVVRDGRGNETHLQFDDQRGNAGSRIANVGSTRMLGVVAGSRVLPLEDLNVLGPDRAQVLVGEALRELLSSRCSHLISRAHPIVVMPQFMHEHMNEGEEV